ncbi:hypothetical protein N7499_001910 [Penicillium canescens]|uniref:Uncharacterized protein n=1 Tax=Penicillium canescens TaxID=5083 RepID=A0AAD6I7W3_PENCN|nr:uncharacterized protein N7446_009445 [Penicillium canescens]KAJ6002224.1 hypothetical protein N7522_007451 [Penicillium canescens]KAJ6034691.1 hypothetical protein N7460_008866 [Penicillium canescens]KAJ6046353.1 hypothetical protein N7444_007607 [Penicillium canescens]KAJ6053433.1 hypothetical protein N7446_009445 [Penicillium canescens]KAJ6097536.1 hypothetical protein N7499_001910 [Penicillium canescens]
MALQILATACPIREDKGRTMLQLHHSDTEVNRLLQIVFLTRASQYCYHVNNQTGGPWHSPATYGAVGGPGGAPAAPAEPVEPVL